MSLDSLSSDTLLKIIGYLPLKDKCRIARVSRRFDEISRKAIEETKSLDVYDDDVFQYSVSHSFSTLLDLCSSNLKEIVLSIDDEHEHPLWMKILAQYSYPRLEKLAISIKDSSHFGNLIRRCPNLKCLEHRRPESFSMIEFPADLVLEKLETLNIRIGFLANEILHVRSLAPNLRHLVLHNADRREEHVDAFDDLFASVPNLQTLHIFFGGWPPPSFPPGHSTHFWKLSSLTDLKISVCEDYHEHRSKMTEVFLQKISVSFLRLERLRLRVNDFMARDVSALAALVSLRELHFYTRGPVNGCSVAQLTNCHQLRELVISATLPRETVISLIFSCPHLRNLVAESITEIKTEEMLINFLKSLSALEGRDLNMWFCKDWPGEGFYKICDTDLVKIALDELADSGGPKIRIRPWRGYSVYRDWSSSQSDG